MKTRPDDQAFPRPYVDGMTKREYFAGQALIATSGTFVDPKLASEYALQVADALIAELNKDTKDDK